jgi:excisionase family DNA binding protein
MDKIMTIPEVATYLQISKSKVYYLVQRGEIPHIKIGRNVRIREVDLAKWLMAQMVPEVRETQFPIGKKVLARERSQQVVTE